MNCPIRTILSIMFLVVCITSAYGSNKEPEKDSTFMGNSNIDPARFHTYSTMVGVGYRNSLDTYLSPEEYVGTEIRLIRENQRMTKLLDGRISVQNLLQGNFSYTKSPTEDGKELAGLIDWNITWHYNWCALPHLRVLAGCGLGAHGGFTYNTRNGNNPAQARLGTDLNLSGMAIYELNLWNRVFNIRYQADLPTLGLMFSPNYGQSYYELFSLGNYDHNVCFTNLFQAFSFNQLLTVDIPFNSGSTLRVGYCGVIRQSQVNNLKQHDWSHLFLVGYVKNFYLVKHKRVRVSANDTQR